MVQGRQRLEPAAAEGGGIGGRAIRETTPRLVAALESIRGAYGPDPRRERARLIDALECRALSSPALLLRYHEALLFLRAFPDDAAALRRVDAALARIGGRVAAFPGRRPPVELADSGLPGTENVHPYSHSMVRELLRAHPGDLEIDWKQVEDSSAFFEMVNLAVLPAEVPGVDDEWVEGDDWLRVAGGADGGAATAARASSAAGTYPAASNAPARPTDLSLLLRLIEGRPWSEPLRAALFDGLKLPIRWRIARPGAARTTAIRLPERPRFHPGPLRRGRFRVAARVRRPIPRPRKLPPAEAAQAIAWMKSAMSVRNRELYPLCHPSAEDAWQVDLDRGLSVVVLGVEPEFRLLLEGLHGHFLLKNGVPVGYALSSVLAGECEIGINIYDTFRQGETGLLYADLMRLFHHLLGADYFFVPRRQIGYEGDEGIESGAYWFYDKLGFRSKDAVLRRLADAERARIHAERGYRTPAKLLRRLAEQDLFFSLDPRRRPEGQLSHGRISLQVTGWITRRFAGDRAAAGRFAVREAGRRLGLPATSGWTPAERRALARLSPLVALIPDWERWPARDRAALRAVVRARGGVNEAEYVRLSTRHRRWVEWLRRLSAS